MNTSNEFDPIFHSIDLIMCHLCASEYLYFLNVAQSQFLCTALNICIYLKYIVFYFVPLNPEEKIKWSLISTFSAEGTESSGL